MPTAKIRRLVGQTLLAIRKQEPCIIVMVDGGLCSAMTKYVLGECFRKQLGMPVKYDLSWFDTDGLDCDNLHPRDFTLKQLFPELDMKEATPDEISFYKRYFYFKNPQHYIFNDALFLKSVPLYIDGYAENWKYVDMVKETCLQELDFSTLQITPENQLVLDDIENQDCSIAIHVRRGDYVNLGMSFLDDNYYIRAVHEVMRRVQPAKTKLFFFSDDISWVRQKLVARLPEGIDHMCVDVNDGQAGHFDLYLISKCDHQISSNSSFGYWGGILNRNPEKIVILPRQWLPMKTDAVEVEGSENAHDFPGFITLDVKGASA